MAIQNLKSNYGKINESQEEFKPQTSARIYAWPKNHENNLSLEALSKAPLVQYDTNMSEIDTVSGHYARKLKGIKETPSNKILSLEGIITALDNGEIPQIKSGDYLTAMTSIVYGPNNEGIKVVPESQNLQDIKYLEKGLLNNGRFHLGNQVNFENYPSELNGFKLYFSKEELSKYSNPLSSEDAINDPLLLALMNGNKSLLKKFVNTYNVGNGIKINLSDDVMREVIVDMYGTSIINVVRGPLDNQGGFFVSKE